MLLAHSLALAHNPPTGSAGVSPASLASATLVLPGSTRGTRVPVAATARLIAPPLHWG